MSTGLVRGVALAPGVSRNKRLYTRENITRAYNRLTARIADPNGRPVLMRTHHAAGDDSTRIVARVTNVRLDDTGALRYVGEFADTPKAQEIRTLAKPTDGKAFLTGASIYGRWVGDVETTQVDGQNVETADDIEIDFIDFTASPGVDAATATAETTTPNAISESHEAEITVTETHTAEVADKEPHGNVTYADPGYQDDKVKRYPIDTANHVRAAWSYINQAKNQKPYTAAQVKRIKTRIRTAAKRTGVTISDSWLYSGTATLAEGYWVDDCQPSGSFSFCATNGPITATICSYCLDPADLEVVTRAACQAITDALKALDPDMDGDIDLPDDEDADGADQMETQTPDADQAAETQAATAESTKEDAVETTETTTQGAAEAAPVAETAPVKVEIDYKALAEAFLAVSKAAEPVQPETQETTDDKTDLRESLKDVVRELLAESTTPATRKGFAVAETANPEPDAAELWAKRGELFIAAARENR